jgi:hypothetical protein
MVMLACVLLAFVPIGILSYTAGQDAERWMRDWERNTHERRNDNAGE